ncbi:DMT family transporter [Haloflavibacter putidus]|uniref:DMT family transporter n=1 Tax=Haloflavibacter putidus TaxID=2576776 RepID=A0A507ZPT0_9FLAO|nr:DMT family transporter [Haloflavibacter putidus]TQD38591.1 DMT family transporter [Haloflavibacter putidus]
MGRQQLKWFYLIALALVWGSSFILIKKGLVGLTPIQLGALRVCFASVFIFLIGAKSIKKIKKEHWRYIALSGFLGTFFPAFLFAFAETKVDSGIVSILNSTVPILALIIGALVFKIKATSNQILGVVVGLLGSIFLVGTEAVSIGKTNFIYAFLPLIATVMYAFNVHIIKRFLQEVSALSITLGFFIVLFPFALGVLFFTGFFNEQVLTNPKVQTSIFYIAILAVFGTGIAKIIFNRLVQLSTPLFTTSVTYLIPVIALMWGLLDGEKFSFMQLLSGLFILIGVYLANKKTGTKAGLDKKFSKS